MKCMIVLALAAVATALPAAPGYSASASSYTYHGKYGGKCEYDGIYYRDPVSFIFCSNGNSYEQPCAPGTENSDYASYKYGNQYSYSDFCDVNLVALGKYYAPKYEAPKYEEPKYEEPKYEEPKYEEPKYEEPKYEAPKYEEPKYEAPKYEEPKYEEPKYEEPKYEPKKDYGYAPRKDYGYEPRYDGYGYNRGYGYDRYDNRGYGYDRYNRGYGYDSYNRGYNGYAY